ncbi:MAG TPA: LacI family DNA-binding transcriptional regulator [Fimbriimonadaceae bacterium]|jgi:LacI family transcriptional regulator
MRTTLKDVAKRLDLSPSLVSGVLNDRPNVWASEETRARVIEAARDLNYHASAAARALSGGKTNTVAFVYRRLEGADYRLAYSGLVDVFSAQLQERGLSLMVSNFATEEEVLSQLQRLASSHGCDAVILWGREADTEVQGELLERLKMPFFVKGRHEKTHPDWPQIDFDHEWMMKQAVDSLLDLGHRKLAYIGFPHNEAFVHSLKRGFCSAHKERLGIDPHPRFLAEIEDAPISNEKKIQEWLSYSETDRPTGFVIGSGNAAWHALETGLAHVGCNLGLEDSAYAAAGIASVPFTLMFGNARVYQGIEIDSLARIALPDLLEAVVGESHMDRVLRFRPALTKAPTLDLLKHGVQFVTESLDGGTS